MAPAAPWQLIPRLLLFFELRANRNSCTEALRCACTHVLYLHVFVCLSSPMKCLHSSRRLSLPHTRTVKRGQMKRRTYMCNPDAVPGQIRSHKRDYHVKQKHIFVNEWLLLEICWGALIFAFYDLWGPTPLWFPSRSLCITAWTAASRPPLLLCCNYFWHRPKKCRWQNDDSQSSQKNTGECGWVSAWMREIIRREEAGKRPQNKNINTGGGDILCEVE